ncbi:MAG: GGDEF domain-containing protein [Planctomycetota bacterium]
MTDPSTKTQVLVVSPRRQLRQRLAAALAGAERGWDVVERRELPERPYADAIILAEAWPADRTQREALLDGAPAVVIVAPPEEATRAVELGAAFLPEGRKNLPALPAMVDKALRDRAHHRELRGALDHSRSRAGRLLRIVRQLQRDAATDALTGLSNRRRFEDVLRRDFHRALRYGHDLTCCLCDVDHLKHINDQHGHAAGDRALRLVARTVRASLRASDTAARYGGDEVVLLLPHTAVDRGLAVVERIRGEMQEFCERDGEAIVPVSLSVGVASLRADRPGGPEDLVALADRALYAAKAVGRCCSVLHQQLPRTTPV